MNIRPSRRLLAALLFGIAAAWAITAAADEKVGPIPNAPGIAAPGVPAAPETPGPPSASSGASAPAGQTPPAPIATSTAPALALAATFGAGPTIRSGLEWRVFQTGLDAGDARKLVADSSEATPLLRLAQGDYVVHVSYGLAGASQAVSVPSVGVASARIPLRAGALRVTGVLGAEPIPPDRLSIDIYVPEPGNSEARLVVRNGRPGEAIGLPEGQYHVVSTYLDTVGVGSLKAPAHGTPTNSIISADLAVETGKLTDVTLRHRVAVLTLKLVKAPGGEALANTEFTVLTPGGDVIRELVGAFPSLVLAEGDYVAIARRDGKTYQAEFSVQASVDRDVEVIAK